MTLADRLRDALHRTPEQAPVLMAGDEGNAPDAPPMPAAVLVPVVDRPEPGVILTLRAETVRRHAGQVAFPGGRIDPGDDGPVAAALRETEEEIGLPRGHVQVIGTTDRYRTVTGFDVTPVLGVVPADIPLTLQSDEVAAAFEVPLFHLLEPEHQILRSIEWHGQQRNYYEIEWEGRRIWGATAAIIVNLSRRLALAP